MASGWQDGGAVQNDASTNRLFCADPPGENARLTRESALPNVFLGGNFDRELVFANPGAANFSIEWWMRLKYPSLSWDTDNINDTGFREPGGNRGLLRFTGTNTQLHYEGGLTADVTVPISSLPLDWYHFAGTFDRAGVMTYYINGRSQGTAGIDADPFGGSTLFVTLLPNGGGALPLPVTRTPFIIGPLALHSTLLTSTQIANSVRGRTVQKLGTSTFYATHWNQFIGGRFYQTLDDYETDPPTDQTPPLGDATFETYIRAIYSVVTANVIDPMFFVDWPTADSSTGFIPDMNEPPGSLKGRPTNGTWEDLEGSILAFTHDPFFTF